MKKPAKLANKMNAIEKYWQNWHKDKSPRHAEHIQMAISIVNITKKIFSD